MDFRRRLSGIPIKISENKTENSENCMKYAKLKNEYDSKRTDLSPGENEKNSEKNLKAEKKVVDLPVRGDIKNDSFQDISAESFSRIKYTRLKEDFDSKCIEMNQDIDGNIGEKIGKPEIDLLDRNFQNGGSKGKAAESSTCENKYLMQKGEFNGKYAESNPGADENKGEENLKTVHEAVGLLARPDSKSIGSKVKAMESFSGTKYTILNKKSDGKCIGKKPGPYEKLEEVDYLATGDFNNGCSKDKASAYFQAKQKKEFDGKYIGLSLKVDEKRIEKILKECQETIDSLDRNFHNNGSKGKSEETFNNPKFKDSGFKTMKEKEVCEKKTSKAKKLKNAVSQTFYVTNRQPSYRPIKSEDETSESYRYLLFVFAIILYLYWVYKTCS